MGAIHLLVPGILAVSQTAAQLISSRPPPTPIDCQYANNTLGVCECAEQLFIAHQCHSGFFCLTSSDSGIETDVGTFHGCEIECDPGYILVVNPHNTGSWSCHQTNDNSAGLMC